MRERDEIKGNKMIDAREEEERISKNSTSTTTKNSHSFQQKKTNTVLKGIEEAKAKGLKISAVEVRK